MNTLNASNEDRTGNNGSTVVQNYASDDVVVELSKSTIKCTCKDCGVIFESDFPWGEVCM